MAKQDTSMYLESAIRFTLTKCSEACVVLFGNFSYFVNFENCHLSSKFEYLREALTNLQDLGHFETLHGARFLKHPLIKFLDAFGA